MGADGWLPMALRARANTALDEVNRQLAGAGLAITREEARLLAQRRNEALAETERVEFATPAIVLLAEMVASSPKLSQSSVAQDLAYLQDAFYAIRDELPADVPDIEIAEALRGCLDAWGDAAELASLSTDEVMRFSDDYVRATEGESLSAYRIVDDEGRTYSFDPAEWDYDEQAAGWDDEEWADARDDEQA